MAQVLGIVDIYWLGQLLPSKPGGKVTLGGVSNKAVVYGRRVGRAQGMLESKVNAQVALEKGMAVSTTFSPDTEGELKVTCDTGQTFVFPDAFIEGTRDITSGDNSQIDVNWAGGTPLEVTA